MTSFRLEIYWEDAILLQPSSVNEWNKVIPNEINTYIKASPPGEVTEVLQHHWCAQNCGTNCASVLVFKFYFRGAFFLSQHQFVQSLAVWARGCTGCKHFFGVGWMSCLIALKTRQPPSCALQIDKTKMSLLLEHEFVQDASTSLELHWFWASLTEFPSWFQIYCCALFLTRIVSGSLLHFPFQIVFPFWSLQHITRRGKLSIISDLHTKDLKVSGFPHQCLHSRRSFFSLNWNAGRVSNAIGYGFGFLTAGSGRTDHAIRKATPSLELSSWFFYPFKAFHEYLSNEH